MYWVEDDYFIGKYSCLLGDTICNDYFKNAAALRGVCKTQPPGKLLICIVGGK